MSIQNIIDNSQSIAIGRTKVASSTIARSGRYKTALIPSSQPFLFVASYRPVSVYADVRGVLEEIDRLDTVFTEQIDIGNTNTNLSWITAYQGDLSTSDLGNIALTTTYSGNSIDIDLSGITGAVSADYVFKAGDFIQFDNGYKYPYTVTQDLQYGAGGTVTLTLNRPIIEQSGYTISGTKGLLVGPACVWQVKMLEKPTYNLLPGRLVEFDGEFSLIEIVED
jgi:hypothetical protein